MKQRIYLDTSVISALGDARAPDRQELTREFFDRLSSFESAASDITRLEIERTKDSSRRDEMLTILERCDHILSSSVQAESLASNYLAAAIFPASVPEDALHVAIAVLNRQDVIVSWNFKHLVNQRRRAAIDALNLSIGLPPIIILAPPEV